MSLSIETPRTRSPKKHPAAKIAAAALFGILGFAAPGFAQTGIFFDEYGAGVRSSSMGQAFTGIADDGSAAYYNPAGIAFAAPQTAIGWRYTKPRTRYSSSCPAELANRPVVCPPVPVPPLPEPGAPIGETLIPSPPGTEPRNFSVNFDSPSTKGIQINVISDLNYDALNEKLPFLEPLQLGASVFLPLKQLSSFSTFQDQGEPYFFRYDSRPALLNIGISLAYAFDDWIAIGGGIMPMITSEQKSASSIRLNAPEGDPTKGLDFTIFQEGSIELMPVVGVLVKPPVFDLQELLSLGFSYRGEVGIFFGTGPSQQTFGFEEEDEFIALFGFPPGQVVNYVGFSPEQFTFGAGVTPSEGTVLGFDVTFKRWEEFRYWLNEFPEPKFENTWTFRIGGEHVIPMLQDTYIPETQLSSLALRAGYYFEPTPVTTLDGRFNILDSDQHVVSGGLGVGLTVLEKFEVGLDFVFQAHLLNSRSTDNRDDPRFGPLKMDGNVYHLGFEITFDR